MKFLCVSCDLQMKSTGALRQREDGTMSLVLECPECGREFAMLTNQMETKLLDSLDVSLCPVGGKGREEAEAALERAKAGAETGEASKCPFSDMVARDDAALAAGAAALDWASDAEKRLENIPSFVRPMARRGIEMYAREQGHGLITLEVMDEAKHVIGM